MEHKTHFKKAFNSAYLGSQDLPESKDINLTIKEVLLQESKGLKEDSIFNIAYFKQSVKPMLLNVTNSKTLSRLAKSKYIEDWGGIEITIGVQSVRAFGADHDALRIRPVTRVLKTTLTAEHPKWLEVAEKIKSGVKIAAIRKYYDITDELFNTVEL
jgi:hypothetical protein